MDISNSEIESFLRCRRMWSFESNNREGLRPINPSPHMAFHVGSVFHQVLEAQISLGKRPNIGAVISVAEEELEQYYREIVGVGWSSSERELLAESRALIHGLSSNYFDHYGNENPLGSEFKYVHAEVTFRVPIPGTIHHLRGTIDGIARHISGEVYLVEHKTTSASFPSIADLVISRQLQAYCWAAGKMLGEPVAGIIYDGVWKKVPEFPAVTLKGTLSKAAIATTPSMYRKAIQALDLNEEDYADILDKLSEDKFFRRHIIRYTPKSLEIFAGQLHDLVEDMANPKLPLYPNRVWQGCWDCRFQDLCVAMQMGEDVDTIREFKYRPGELSPSKRTPAVSILELRDL